MEEVHLRVSHPVLLDELKEVARKGDFKTTFVEMAAVNWILARNQRVNSMDQYIDNEGPTIPRDLEDKIMKYGVRYCVRQGYITGRPQLKKLNDLCRKVAKEFDTYHFGIQ